MVPAYSEPGTKGRGGFIWYLFCTISRSGKFRLAAWISISTWPAGLRGRQFFPGQGIDAHGVFAQPGMHESSPVEMRRHDRQAGRTRNVSAVTGATRDLQSVPTCIAHENPPLQRRRLPGAWHRGPVRGAQSLADVEVVAPEHNNSAKSNALTLHSPLYVHRAPNGFRYVNGTPADCVHIALTGLLGYRPDLVVSGINNGANMGDDTIYSGTVGAAMEGYLFGIPAIAFSQSKRAGPIWMQRQPRPVNWWPS
jgi:hypothetical protein